eukprot:3992641-Prymnesium_polylepis.3
MTTPPGALTSPWGSLLPQRAFIGRALIINSDHHRWRRSHSAERLAFTGEQTPGRTDANRVDGSRAGELAALWGADPDKAHIHRGHPTRSATGGETQAGDDGAASDQTQGRIEHGQAERP